MDSGQIILFQTQGGKTKIEVRLANESVWLTADQMAELFQRDRSTIQRHVKRIYEERELTPDSTCAFFAQVQTEGKRRVERQIPIYNLDMIISVGYRVNSHRGVQFRQWATQVLKEYLIKGVGKELLTHAGSISAEVAKLKADTEYEKFRERTQYQLSPVEIHFIEAFEAEQKKLRGETK